MRRRLFDHIAAASLLIGIASAWAWYSAVQSYVSQGDLIEQQGREIERQIQNESWNTAAYRRYVAQYHAWTEVRDAYRCREPQERAAYHLRYIVLPRALVIALAVPPTVWLVVFWWRCERRWARRAFDVPTRWRRARRVVFRGAAAASFILSLAIASWWVRSDFVGDSFLVTSFFDDGDRTFWRQTALQSGRGSIGVDGRIQSGPRGDYRREIENAYIRSFGRSLSSLPFHSSHAPRDLDFRFGTDHRKWGFVWGYFEHGRAGSRPENNGYELMAPFWSLEVVFLTLPLLWAWRKLRLRLLARPGHCRCGYDLTGNVSGVCPECGTPVPTMEEAA